MPSMLIWIVQFFQSCIPTPPLRLAWQPLAAVPSAASWAHSGHFPRILSTRSRLSDEGRRPRHSFLSGKLSLRGRGLPIQVQAHVHQARRKPAYQLRGPTNTPAAGAEGAHPVLYWSRPLPYGVIDQT
jgi:hypothetical protein